MVQGVLIEEGNIVDLNPATGEVVARVRVASAEQVDAAVQAARRAQPRWAAQPLRQRASEVAAAARQLGAERAELAKLITTEMGKVLKEAEEEVDIAADKDEFCELVANANEPQVHGSSIIIRQPHGVVAICAPWNFPVDEILLLAIPALIAGNGVVIKPSEVAPLSGERAVLALARGLSDHPGLVGLVQGDGEVGAQLVSHPGVDMIGFTGSTATGTKILTAAAKTLKPVVLECGGKDPMIVFADADLDRAAADAVAFSLANAGQVCCAVERVYVAKSVAREFESLVLKHASSYQAGNGLSHKASIGPLASAMQRDIVHSHVTAAIASGARCLLGGQMPSKAQRGNFYPPTVLVDVPHSAKQITQEETFGPVVAISTFDGSESEAIRLANDSTYGLTASVYGGDIARASRVASQISAGQVGVNTNPFSGSANAMCPFVGHKRSGYGCHSGADGWRQFSAPKSLVYDPERPPPGSHALPPIARPSSKL